MSNKKTPTKLGLRADPPSIARGIVPTHALMPRAAQFPLSYVPACSTNIRERLNAERIRLGLGVPPP